MMITSPLGWIYISLSLLLGIVGRHRKLGFWGYFFASLALSPLMGLLLLLASDRRPEKSSGN